jgi:acetate kinase
MLDEITRRRPPTRLVAAGHRVTHGGSRFTAPARVTPEVLSELEGLAPLAPLHNPPQVRAIREMARREPDLPQVACFDTAFHATMPQVERWFGLPRSLSARGLVRYGFHGLSYEYIASALPRHAGDAARDRVVVAHLGHGSSLCAMRAGVSQATTMSFTPLDGLPGATRSGSLDPGVVLHLLLTEGKTADEVGHLLWEQSGLLGVSGVSGDLRVLLASHDREAAEAVGLLVHRIVREIGAMVAVLGGLDLLVFTGGIGEGSAQIRLRILERLAWLGLQPDAPANRAGGPRLTAPDRHPSAWVIRTDEESVIARSALALL